MTVLARLLATLSGAAETIPVDPSARGMALIELRSDGSALVGATGEAAWSHTVTAAHIHRGGAGTDGPIVADLLAGGAVDHGTHTADGALSLTPELAAEIAGNPAGFYVNVHTAAAPGGLARGQLASFGGAGLTAALSAQEETPPIGNGATGGAALRVRGDRTLDWAVALASPPISTISMAHVHVGGLGVPGPILVMLDLAAATLDGAANSAEGSVVLSPGTITRLLMDPAGHYVNLHTAAFPAGALRGQLDTETVEVWAHLRGDREPQPVAPGARGAVGIQIQSTQFGRVMLAVPVGIGLATITAADVAFGGPGANGPTLIHLMAGADFAGSAATGSAEGTVVFELKTCALLIGNPGVLHARFRTAAAPNGLCRGQLGRAPQTLVAQLSGGNEVPPVTPTNSGKLRVILTGLFRCTYSLTMAQPPVGDIHMAHVHDAFAGANGPILIDLMVHDGTIASNTVSGDTTFTGRTFVRVLADPVAYYGNAHTLALPTGAARGQLNLLTEDGPPLGLTYASPVTYVTGAEIAQSVPDSIGGSVSSYSVAPALPAGLALDPLTGILSGTPTAITPEAVYVVTAHNAAGSSAFGLTLTVDEGPPLTLAYATPQVYVVGTSITPLGPVATGGAITSFSVAPALPAGLSVHATTGAITGTPTVAAAAADYVVTGTNGGGSVNATVNLRVDALLVAPDNLVYTTPVQYGTGTAITPNVPSVGGGAPTSYSVNPALPAGLTLNTSTGTLSGTPTTVTAAANYTVTATNSEGSTNATVNIEIVLGAPANLTYDVTVAIGYVTGSTFPVMTPSHSGGTVATYTIAPALPAGVAINASTGVISGAPTAQSGQTNYTVTATNAAGNTTAQVTVTILP